jgi:pyruvate,water dikinase
LKRCHTSDELKYLSQLRSSVDSTPSGEKQEFEEWNDSLAGDYLWTRTNVGEAVPDVMTPCTWSVVLICMSYASPVSFLEGIGEYHPIGNIGGRFYLNVSLNTTIAGVFVVGQKQINAAFEEAYGRIPNGIEVPGVPAPRWKLLRAFLWNVVPLLRRVRANQKKLPTFLAWAPGRCEALRDRIQAASSTSELIRLWQTELEPFFSECGQMLDAATGSTSILAQGELRKLVGEADANALVSGLSTGQSQLASLGPLLGLTQLARGEIDRETFAREYGHRSPHEVEVSFPRAAEDPDWIDRQLAGLREAPVDVTTLLSRQKEAQAAAWQRFQQRYPRKAAKMRRRLDNAAAVYRNREAARSELVRAVWAVRVFVLQAGKLTGQGDGMFFLSIDEILAVLGGDETALSHISARRATYARYCTLPPYPVLIRGHFDPFQWAADPRRRSDIFISSAGTSAPEGSTVTGHPGSAGVVEGRARVILDANEGDQLQAGEILVTTLTNVGWTPLFPRAAAVVTDIGAPLSHAAIVARELGIPAVVGCGNATMRLHTGDWLRVNGEQGIVDVLRQMSRRSIVNT